MARFVEARDVRGRPGLRAVLAVALLLGGCNFFSCPRHRGPPEVRDRRVATLSSTPKRIALPVGDTRGVFFSARNSAGQHIFGADVALTVTGTAARYEDGVVTALSVGTATLTASSGGVQVDLPIEVTEGGPRLPAPPRPPITQEPLGPAPGPSAGGADLVLHPERPQQTMQGWEATSETGQEECDRAVYEAYREEVFDRAIDDLGITRVRLEVRSGAENPEDHFGERLAREISDERWREVRYLSIDDDDDPFHRAPGRFHFTELSHTVENVVLPLKRRLEAKGERLYVSLCVVDFGQSRFDHWADPEEYAELVLAAFEHLKAEHDLVPDALEVILEPDVALGWPPTAVGPALVAAGARLEAVGFRPAFVAPSTSDLSKGVPYLQELLQTPGARRYLREVSYHRYRGATPASLRALEKHARAEGLATAMLEHIGADPEELYEDLTVGRNHAWALYALAFCAGDSGGDYMYVDAKAGPPYEVHYSENARALPRFMRRVRPGAVRYEVEATSGVARAVAFAHPRLGHTVVILADEDGPITLANLPEGRYRVERTTEQVLYAEEGPVEVKDTLQVSASAGDVITVSALPAAATE